MFDIRKAWNGIGGGRSHAPISTIPRDVFSRRAAIDVQLTTLDAIEPSETRTAPRFLPAKTTTVLTTKSGKRLAARIINVSCTGVAVEAEAVDLRADDVAKVGSRPVTPGRRVAHGIVLVFQTPMKPEECGPDIVL